MEEKESCCGPKKEGKGFFSGLIYGLIPHTGCIAFILFTILGVTTATSFFRPLLMNRYFFHILILLSFVFATISAGVYLGKRGMLSLEGAARKWRYLSILYGTSIGINILLFLVIFPLAANITGAVSADDAKGLSQITLKVDIPCPGHAPLISESLKGVLGVKSVQYRFPDYFDVYYDTKWTSIPEMLAIDVFEPYPAEIVAQKPAKPAAVQNSAVRGCSRCGGCSGACGGTCSINT